MLYSGNMHPLVRKKAAQWAHQYLKPFLIGMEPIVLKDDEYLRIELHIYEVIGRENWDVSNKWPWIKWFEDSLQELGKIEDDNVEYVRDSGRIIYHPVREEAQRKLTFIISKYVD